MPPPPRDNPKPRKEKKAKPAPEEALDLLKKGTQRIIEADGMETMLRTGGMHLGSSIKSSYDENVEALRTSSD